MRTAQKGFTLAELLIALALLGVIAAFTIPKVLQASGDQEAVAKVREAASTLEQAWYNLKMQNQQFQNGSANQRLYTAIITDLNTVDNAATAVNAANAPYAGLAPAHPCSAAPANLGWARFANGVVVSGMMGPGAGNNLTAIDPANAAFVEAASTYVLCIDYNGAASPNTPGVDVFVGNFAQWGNFDATSGNLYPPRRTSKSFHWGSTNPANGMIFAANGAALAGALATPQTRVGLKMN